MGLRLSPGGCLGVGLWEGAPRPLTGSHSEGTGVRGEEGRWDTPSGPILPYLPQGLRSRTCPYCPGDTPRFLTVQFSVHSKRRVSDCHTCH